MYLMNVPPVAAARSEWRTCGPPGGYSLPTCFNDSDTELSTRGTPIADKVQMIIESLRSSQSSLEMGDEIEGNALLGQESHPQACKAAMGSYVGVKSKTKCPTENQQADDSSPINHENSDSDSDDSVDRGIEEAILEYLKEKDDHKRKAEPCFSFLQSKLPRKNPPIPEVSKQNPDCNAFSIDSNQFLKSVKAEHLPVPVVPIKKHIKHKESLNDTVKKLDPNKSTIKSFVLPKEQTSKTMSLFNKVKCSVAVKVEEDSNDSSSDDGIEEAIQRYQLEKKEQQVKREASEEESDSTSDDGIEEAIRCYQLEQLKEKSVLKPLLHKQKPFSKSLIHSVGSTSTKNRKKHKPRKKKPRMEKSVQPSSAFIPKNTPSDSPKSKGNGLILFKVESLREPPSTPPKATTTAELMCAEAILDISKTVMPEAFHHSVGLSSCAPAESSLPSSLPGPAEESDGSSIDSEDGIEQEIRKFLEQKAQMHKEPPKSATSQERNGANEGEEVKAKQVAAQKKPPRSTLTQRRKDREENCVDMAGTDNVDDPAPKLAKEPVSRRSPTHQKAGLRKTEQSGDKSSSLDSDEDLDTAIKDLLKTKKKLKKKTRDLRQKSSNRVKDEGPTLGNASPAKKLKLDPTSKCCALNKVQKSKKSLSHQKQTSKSAQAALDIREDSSSVDSDDSIELEIRKFLAEKAKVSTAEKNKDGDVSTNGTIQDEDRKQENQLAEIPRKSINPPSEQPPQPQSSPPVVTTASAQSRRTSVPSGSPSLLEPADGAGAARTEPRKSNTQDVTPHVERVRPLLSPNNARSHSESIKWRQSFGLPITDTRTLSRTPFCITSSKISETASATPAFQRGVIAPKTQTPVNVWSSARTSRAVFPCSAETTVNTMFRSPGLNLFSTARQHPRVSFTQSLAAGHRSPCPAEGETKSMVHITKDKSVFVELESNRTNHVQVRSRDQCEGKERADLLSERKREGESVKIEEKEVHLDGTGEEFIDEAESESGSSSRRGPEKEQGFSTLSLSSAIDPGMTFRPCIALTTEERSRMFRRRSLARKCKKDFLARSLEPVQKVKNVKRKLVFIPVAGEMKRLALT